MSIKKYSLSLPLPFFDECNWKKRVQYLAIDNLFVLSMLSVRTYSVAAIETFITTKYKLVDIGVGMFDA